jgi:hypothetical protein
MAAILKTGIVQENSSSVANLTLDSSGNVTAGNNLTVTGTSTLTGAISTGAITSSGLVTGATGALYPVVQGTAQASTSGTSITFSSIPSWVKRITVMFSGVSTNGTSVIQIQVGSGSVTSSGYAAQSGNRAVDVTSTTGFPVTVTNTAASLWSGIATLSLANSSTNTWVMSGTLDASAASSSVNFSAGGVSLSGTLDRVVITTVNGTDTFDAGSINIQYE